MSWALLLGLVISLGFAVLVSYERRVGLRRMRQTVRKRERAVESGAAKAQLQHPIVDLSRCLGCATCVAVCPEDGVLELVHGQAVVVNGARCVGVSACERECPVGAITVTLTDVESRDDIPAISEDLEAVGTPGLFLAGEVTAHALIKVAIDHGAAVATEVAARLERARVAPAGAATVTTSVVAGGSSKPSPSAGPNGMDGDATALEHAMTAVAVADAPMDAAGAFGETADSSGRLFDLLIVGAGPAGLACALEAKRRGLDFVVIDQEAGIGGTVAKYPRRKLVMTEPVELPLYGRLRRTYTKEELMSEWQAIVEKHALPIHHERVFAGLSREAGGAFEVKTATEAMAKATGPSYRAQNVCLAIGRRGVPRRLGVPGEGATKVSYSLMDANSYQGRRILVVGGGDAAVEAATALADQPGNEVTLSYRKAEFFRIRAKNEQRLAERVETPGLTVVTRSELREVEDDSVVLSVTSEHGERTTQVVPNDDVFIMAGGVPPFELMSSAGVSFDPALRPMVGKTVGERGTGLGQALVIGFTISLITLAFALWHYDYYGLENAARPTHGKHGWLRPGQGLGLWLGVISVAMIAANLAYLLRRAPGIRFTLGSLEHWMTSHVATGIFALLCATLHAAMSPSDTSGGHAFWALAILLVTGAIGRYFYAWVPRAANGRELELAEVKSRLGRLADGWDQGQREFQARARPAVLALVEKRQWGGSFRARAGAIFGGQRDLRRLTKKLGEDGRVQGVAEDHIRQTIELSRQVFRTAVMVRRYEDLRAVLNTWRYLHRWVAALMVLLVLLHVFHAVIYGSVFNSRVAG